MFEINQYMRTNNNGDELGYIKAAYDPHNLLVQNEIRQSRPLYILQNTIIGWGLFYITDPFHKYMVQTPIFKKLGTHLASLNSGVIRLLGSQVASYPNAQTPQYNDFDLSVKIPIFFFAYILSNILILLLSLLLFEKIWKKATDISSNSLLFFVLLWFLLSSVLTQYFFWSAHQQMCNILSPMFCIWICFSILDGSIDKTAKLLALSLLGGVLMLYYGNFVLALPSIILTYMYKHRKGFRFIHMALFSIGVAILFAIPTLSWILYLKTIGVKYYNHEVTGWREVVWVFDLIKLPPSKGIRLLASNAIYYSYSFRVFPPCIVWLVLVRVLLGGNGIADTPIKKEFSFTLLICFISIFSFYYIVGFYALRLSYGTTVPLLCVTPLLLNKSRVSKEKTWLLLIIVSAWYLFLIKFW
jgi:hypothetical protein